MFGDSIHNMADITISASDSTTDSYSPPGKTLSPRRERKSPLEFELETCGRRLTVVYDSMLNENMSSVPFLKTFDKKIERCSRAEFVRLPSSQNRFEICYEKMTLPICISNGLNISCPFYCTTFPEKRLFLGRTFGKKYIRNIDLRSKLMTLSDGKTCESVVRFTRLRYKTKSSMK